MEQKKKPLRIPNRDRKGKFAANIAEFKNDDVALALAEFLKKQEKKDDKGTA
jgi:hypothetical protein